MGEVKWIKLSTDLFNNRKIRQIERMEDGDAIIVIWLKLLILAGEINDGGEIYFTKEVPFTEESLSIQFDRPRELIALALRTFQAFGMIDVTEDSMSIMNWGKYQNVDRMEEIREYNRQAKQRSREKQRATMESPYCQYCGQSATGYDHIVPKSKGGLDIDSNKVPCCPRCNKVKKDMPLVNFLNGNLGIIDIDTVTNNDKLAKFVRFNGNRFVDVNDSQIDSQGKSQHRIDKKRIDKNREDIIHTSPQTIQDLLLNKWQTNIDGNEANKEIRHE